MAHLLASVKADPGLIGIAPDISGRFLGRGAYRRLVTPPQVIHAFQQVLKRIRTDHSLSDAQRVRKIDGAYEMAAGLICSFPQQLNTKTNESSFAELKAVLESG
jgi:hypothetical protein